jgi:hypothetical protein
MQGAGTEGGVKARSARQLGIGVGLASEQGAARWLRSGSDGLALRLQSFKPLSYAAALELLSRLS